MCVFRVIHPLTVVVPELDPAQLVPEPLLHQGGAFPGGAWEREFLEDRPIVRGQADRAGLQEAKAQGRALLPDPAGTPLLQVQAPSSAPLSSRYHLPTQQPSSKYNLPTPLSHNSNRCRSVEDGKVIW